MKHKIYHYNFGWRDFGDTSMTNLLDMVKVQSKNQLLRLSEVVAAFQSDAFLLLHVIIVDSLLKVLSFALKEGKVAVHCHAGLGRTGVLIACYLVYYLRYQEIKYNIIENNLVLVTSL